MENNILFNIVQQSFRTALGATAEVVETLQDNQKRNQILSDLNAQWQEKSQIWSEKGTMTEQEAKKIIEQFFKGYNNKNQTPQNIEITLEDNENGSITELTKEIIALREELQNLNESK
jgi:polyhydroxyalkanoate synthesis regulator phasin